MIKINEIEKVLLENAVPSTTIVKIINELEAVEAEKKADAETGPKAKNQFVIMLNGDDTTNRSGWVVQIPDGEDVNTVANRIGAAVKNFNNTSRKGKKKPIKTYKDAFQSLPRKFTKPENVQFKTKDLTVVIPLNGAP